MLVHQLREHIAKGSIAVFAKTNPKIALSGLLRTSCEECRLSSSHFHT